MGSVFLVRRCLEVDDPARQGTGAEWKAPEMNSTGSYLDSRENQKLKYLRSSKFDTWEVASVISDFRPFGASPTSPRSLIEANPQGKSRIESKISGRSATLQMVWNRRSPRQLPTYRTVSSVNILTSGFLCCRDTILYCSFPVLFIPQQFLGEQDHPLLGTAWPEMPIPLMIGSIVLSIRMTRFLEKYFSKNTKKYEKIFGTKNMTSLKTPNLQGILPIPSEEKVRSKTIPTLLSVQGVLVVYSLWNWSLLFCKFGGGNCPCFVRLDPKRRGGCKVVFLWSTGVGGSLSTHIHEKTPPPLLSAGGITRGGVFSCSGPQHRNPPPKMFACGADGQ